MDPAERARRTREAILQAAEERRKERGESEEEYKDRYKTAARKWIVTISALPILLVTSYMLYDRLALGTPVKVLPRPPADKQE